MWANHYWPNGKSGDLMNHPKSVSKLQIGQIRRVILKDGSAELVVIGRVNPLSATCDVLLIDSATDAASTRDFNFFPNSECEFAATILPDYAGNIENEEITESLVYGEICSFCVTELFRASEMQVERPSEFPFGHECLYPGALHHSLLGDEWTYRAEIFKKFSLVCNQFIDAESFFAIREFMHVYSRSSSLESLTKSISGNSSLQDLKNSLNSNPYARMLVRG